MFALSDTKPYPRSVLNSEFVNVQYEFPVVKSVDAPWEEKTHLVSRLLRSSGEGFRCLTRRTGNRSPEGIFGVVTEWLCKLSLLIITPGAPGKNKDCVRLSRSSKMLNDVAHCHI